MNRNKKFTLILLFVMFSICAVGFYVDRKALTKINSLAQAKKLEQERTAAKGM